MDKETRKKVEIKNKREELVVQSNDLIRNARTLRYDLSVFVPLMKFSGGRQGGVFEQRFKLFFFEGFVL